MGVGIGVGVEKKHKDDADPEEERRIGAFASDRISSHRLFNPARPEAKLTPGHCSSRRFAALPQFFLTTLSTAEFNHRDATEYLLLSKSYKACLARLQAHSDQGEKVFSGYTFPDL